MTEEEFREALKDYVLERRKDVVFSELTIDDVPFDDYHVEWVKRTNGGDWDGDLALHRYNELVSIGDNTFFGLR